MRFLWQVILVTAVLAVSIEFDTCWASDDNTAKTSQQPFLLSKLSKIGRVHRLQRPQLTSLNNNGDLKRPRVKLEKRARKSETTLTGAFDEVEFMYDPEVSRKRPYDDEHRKAEANLLANKEKIKTTRGFQQINSIYKSLKRGDKIYGNSNINTVRFIPAIKGKNRLTTKIVSF